MAWPRVLIDRGKEDPAGSRDLGALLAVETVSLRGLGRDASWLRAMLQEALEYGMKRFAEQAPVRISDQWGDWTDIQVSGGRPLASVILPGSTAEDLREAISLFLSRPTWYAERGIPWRLGVGLFGPAGSGKGSAVRALCAEFGLTLYMPDLSGKSMTDGVLLKALGKIGPRSAVLFDDADAVRRPSRDEAPGGVTLGGLFAAMDGPAAGEGRILFLCSNHPEKLDAALLRKGRIDIQIHLGPATLEQARRLFQRWHPEDGHGAERFARAGEGEPMAELQDRLLRGETRGDSAEAAA